MKTTVEFPAVVVAQAWQRCHGQCECHHTAHGHHIPCGRKLDFDKHGAQENGGWEVHIRNRDATPTLENGEVLCHRCYKQSRLYTG